MNRGFTFRPDFVSRIAPINLSGVQLLPALSLGALSGFYVQTAGGFASAAALMTDTFSKQILALMTFLDGAGIKLTTWPGAITGLRSFTLLALSTLSKLAASSDAAVSLLREMQNRFGWPALTRAAVNNSTVNAPLFGRNR